MSDFKMNKEMTRNLIFDLKCSICQDLPGPNGVRKFRYACQKGHLICEDCKFLQCFCKSRSFNGPLSHVENILKTSEWQGCCNFKNGCEDIFETIGLEDHEKLCIFRKIHCPDFDCIKEQSYTSRYHSI